MPIQIQDRDISIIQEIAACRFLSLSQIADLCFNGKREAARKRLEKLVRAGVLISKRVAIASPIYLMASRIAGVVASRRGRDEKRILSATPSFGLIEHELAVRDLRVALLRKAVQKGILIDEFSIDSYGLAFEIDGSVIRPDGFFQTRSNERKRRFFLEVDTGSESLRILGERAKGYRSYYRRCKQGALCSAQGRQNSCWTFRVLFVFKTGARRDSALSYLGELGFKRFVLCTTWKEAFISPFDLIWRVPSRIGGFGELKLLSYPFE